MTKILFLDEDETSFQIRKCIAKALAALPQVELFQARSANEGLKMIEATKFDVVVIDHERPEEQRSFLDGLSSNHPPVVLQTNTTPSAELIRRHITCIPKSETLEGIHQALLIAAAIGEQRSPVVTHAQLH